MNEANDRRPFPVCIFQGESKPSNLPEFLNPLIEEINELKTVGIVFQQRLLQFDYPNCLFICDAPARAFVKSVKGHTGYYGCEKCECEGSRINFKLTYNSMDSTLRTDERFRRRIQEEHHNTPYQTEMSPLELCGTGMVSQFPLEYMHLVCLGVVKKFISLCLKGPLSVRLSANQVQEISAKLLACVPRIPTEFSRTPRDIQLYGRWKATECRQFLLYTGPVILKNILRKPVYDNFMLLSAGIRILLQTDNSMYSCAEKFLDAFFRHYQQLFGEEHCVYNVHNIIHLANDAKTWGNLDRNGAFTFENELGSMKEMVRGLRLPLEQVYRRYKEAEAIPSCSQNKQYPSLERPDGKGFFKQASLPNFKIICDQKNSYVGTHEKFVKVAKIYETEGGIVLEGTALKISSDLFQYPIKSRMLGIVTARKTDKIIKVPLSSITVKFVALPLKHEVALIPLCHTKL